MIPIIGPILEWLDDDLNWPDWAVFLALLVLGPPFIVGCLLVMVASTAAFGFGIYELVRLLP